MNWLWPFRKRSASPRLEFVPELEKIREIAGTKRVTMSGAEFAAMIHERRKPCARCRYRERCRSRKRRRSCVAYREWVASRPRKQ